MKEIIWEKALHFSEEGFQHSDRAPRLILVELSPILATKFQAFFGGWLRLGLGLGLG